MKDKKLFNKDVLISRRLGIPVTTLRDWKKRSDDNWRKKLYNFLKYRPNTILDEEFVNYPISKEDWASLVIDNPK